MLQNRFTRVALTIGLCVLVIVSLLESGKVWGSRAEDKPLFTGFENHSISLSAAQELTSNFRLTTDPKSIVSELFGREAVRAIIDQPECVALRIYFGRKTDGSVALVLVGADADGRDLTDGQLAEVGFPCPPLCDYTSALFQSHGGGGLANSQ